MKTENKEIKGRVLETRQKTKKKQRKGARWEKKLEKKIQTQWNSNLSKGGKKIQRKMKSTVTAQETIGEEDKEYKALYFNN